MLLTLGHLSAVGVVDYGSDLLDFRTNRDVDDTHRLEPDEEAALRRALGRLSV
ncbi:MAG: hypothetical protein ACRD2C_00045 [Acidimicrobiales bacterium]